MAGTTQASPGGVADAIKIDAPGVLPVDGEYALVRTLGTSALLWYRVDEREHARRQLVGLRAVTRPEVLDLLLGLPEGEPVPVSALSAREKAALHRVPPGVVEYDGLSVVRHAITPASVQLALVSARSWKAGLASAARFAPFCTRAMLLHRAPRDLSEMQMQADFYGVGVVLRREGELQLLVAPRPFVRHRFTAAGWQFLEDVYGQVS